MARHQMCSKSTFTNVLKRKKKIRKIFIVADLATLILWGLTAEHTLVELGQYH